MTGLEPAESVLEKTEYLEFKFIVQPVLLVKNSRRTPVEQPADPVTFYGTEALKAWCDAFSDHLAELNQ